jgi:hypothetical protein
MARLSKTYSTEVKARRAAEALRSDRVPGRDIRLLTGCRLRDVRREPTGGFAGAVGPNAPVGTYSDGVRLRRQGRGGFAGNADRHREGSFADAERYVIVTYEDGAERSRVADELGILRLLRGWTLPDETAARLADDLHTGHAVVLVEDAATRDTQGRLDEVARAA